MTFNGVWQIILSFPTEVKGGGSCPSLDTMNNTELIQIAIDLRVYGTKSVNLPAVNNCAE